MPEALRLAGRGASPGRARGPAHVAAAVPNGGKGEVPTDRDVERLADAVNGTIDRLRELAETADLQSGAILEFQIEMLRDPAIVRPSFARIRLGESASRAWVASMDEYVHGFEASEDEHIRARSSDMLDIRNQVLDMLLGQVPADFPKGAVFVGRDIAPSQFLAHDWSAGGAIVLSGGSTASHVAMLARSRGVPMVVGLGEFTIEDGMRLFVDGEEGLVERDEGTLRLAANENAASIGGTAPPPRGHAPTEPARTADGVLVRVMANIDHPSELRGLSPSACDGIGLFRTEYLMTSPGDFDDEDRQARYYSEVLAWAAGAPVTIRLFDFGGDKPLPRASVDPASYLGLRGIRLLLARPDILRVQVRALMRAAPYGNLHVLAPLVTSPDEVAQTMGIFAEEAEDLAMQGIAHGTPPLGIMLEVPAAALMPETFADAAFFSFGTNDLAQYLTAAARGEAVVSHLHEASTAATMRFLSHTVPAALATGKPVGLCGDLATEPSLLPQLLSFGFRAFSMPPTRMALVREALSRLNADGSEAGG